MMDDSVSIIRIRSKDSCLIDTIMIDCKPTGWIRLLPLATYETVGIYELIGCSLVSISLLMSSIANK
jgi:hypothetical protein